MDSKVFELCSDRIERLFPTYVVDEEGHFSAGPETPTLNFDQLKALLLADSSDQNNLDSYQEFLEQT